MRVSYAITKLTEKVLELVTALDNRLTAADNWGPEGNVGQILVSRGPRTVDPPPVFQDIQTLITGNPAIVEAITGPPGAKGDKGGQGDVGPIGPVGPEGPMVPTYVAPAETFTVPLNKQALYALPIVNDGSLVITGDLVMVD